MSQNIVVIFPFLVFSVGAGLKAFSMLFDYAISAATSDAISLISLSGLMLMFSLLNSR